MKVLVIDVGGTNVKMLASGQSERTRFPSGPRLTPAQLVARVKKVAANWDYDVISLGVPGPVLLGQLIANPRNLGPGGTYEDYVGAVALKRLGRKRWRKHVDEVISSFVTQVHADDVVVGGGNAKKLKELPKGCRAGDNAHAFAGGFRLWEKGSGTKDVSNVLKLVPRRRAGSGVMRSTARAKRRA